MDMNLTGRQAVEIATAYVTELYSATSEQLWNLRVEEIEPDEDEGTWSVTVGWTDRSQGAGFISNIGEFGRVYKRLVIDDDSEEVLSMTIREL